MKRIKGMIRLAIVALFCIFSGCSQDDEEFYDSEMFTRAEEGEMMRNGEGGNGGSSLKRMIKWERKKNDETSNPTSISFPTETLCLSNVPNTDNPTLFGEYDNRTLSVSIGNYTGNAILYICSVQGNHLMGSTTLTVENSASQDFSLTGYSTGQSYQIYVILDNAAYVGNFEL